MLTLEILQVIHMAICDVAENPARRDKAIVMAEKEITRILAEHGAAVEGLLAACDNAVRMCELAIDSNADCYVDGAELEAAAKEVKHG